jgi:hypothetical protein
MKQKVLAFYNLDATDNAENMNDWLSRTNGRIIQLTAASAIEQDGGDVEHVLYALVEVEG